MIDVAFVIPGDINSLTGGYAYDREVLRRLPGLGFAARHVALPANYPEPTADDLQETARILSELPPSTILLIDGLAFGAMPESLVSQIRQPIVALVHHPLGYETGLAPERAAALIANERAALTFARRVVVTSPLTKRLLASEFGVPVSAITVAVPGTEKAPRSIAQSQPLHLLSVGSVSQRKAFDVLVDALAPLRDLDWRLTIAGSLARDAAAVETLKSAIARHEFQKRISLPGELRAPRLAKLYAGAGAFVLPSLFEGYGMVLGEAMARGLPIVCTTGGAAAETVPNTASLKVPPGDTAALTDALGKLLRDADLRQRLSDASWKTGSRLPDWGDTALYMAAVIREVRL